MKQKIHLYVTTRSDPVEDLDTVESLSQLQDWTQKVAKHVSKTADYDKPSSKLIKDLNDYTIMECYAVVTHPPGKIHDADDKVGEPLLKFLRDNSGKLKWELREDGVSAIPVEKIAEKQLVLDISKYWDNFTYGLIADKSLGEGEFEVYLEVVAKLI